MTTSSDPSFTVNHRSVALLLGGAHVDRTGSLKAPSVLDSSNPGRFKQGFGGACLNVARNLSALGMQTKLRTVLGDDAYANEIRRDAASLGVDLVAQTISDLPTGTYTSIIEPGGSLLVALADMEIYDRFETALWSEEIRQLNKNDWLCVDANLPTNELAVALKQSMARTVGFTVSAAKAPKLRTLAAQIDLLFTNAVEARALCGEDQIASGLMGLGINNAVISNGSNNIIVVENGTTNSLPVPSIETVVDVTGAGDALAAGTLFALSDGAKLVNAVEFGIRAAQKIVAMEGPGPADLATQLGLAP